VSCPARPSDEKRVRASTARSYYQPRQQARRFFRPFVPTDGLVFDLGANRALRAELFLELGARVVAVEPIPRLTELSAVGTGRAG
jgi:hypothetical protein